MESFRFIIYGNWSRCQNQNTLDWFTVCARSLLRFFVYYWEASYNFVTIVYQYNYLSSRHYPSSCLLFKTRLNSTGFSVPHRKHIKSPLRAQQLNAMYRFVTMVY
jgi:hypothetical protein